MRKILKFSIISLFFINLNAAELTLEDCIKLAFKNNPVLKSKLTELKSAEYSYYSSFNAYYPKFSASGGLTRSGGEGKSVSNSFSTSLNFSQNLFDYESIYSIKSSKINYEIARLNYKNYLIELRKNLFTSFYNLFFAQDLVDVNEKIVEIRKMNAELIELKYRSGFESKGNMLYAKAQYEMAKLNLEKAKRQLEIASNNLKNIIFLNTDDILKVKASSDVEKIDFDKSYIDDVLRKLPQYRIYLKNIELSNEKLKNAKLDWLPSFNLSASKSYSGESFFPDNSSWSFGISMSLPLFSSGITYRKNNIKIVRETLWNYKEKLRNYEITQKNSILNAYSEYLLSLSSLKAYRIFLEASEERFREARIKYLAGKMSYLDLENIEQNLIDARQNMNEYTKNVFLKKINLEYLLGIELK